MGGEKRTAASGDAGDMGSPPHGRGKATWNKRRAPALGITPAWAGKSAAKTAPAFPRRDHPRMGGEKMQINAGLVLNKGSPPHGRGQGGFNGSAFQEVGITPAWAGKRARARSWRGLRQDHPRMGGEKITVMKYPFSPRGSPPHGRGKGAGLRVVSGPHRITPAWAGKRACCPSLSDRRQDHPRMGGEKATAEYQAAMDTGITPAWAGKRSPKTQKK